MNILWINHRDPKHPQAGGAEVHIREVAKRLVKRGHRVTLICERFHGSSAQDTIDGIEIKRIGNKYTIHLIAPIVVSKSAKNYDIIVDDIAHAVPWWSSFLARKPVIGIVLHVHQAVASVELSFPLSSIVKVTERSIKYAYDNLITISYSTKEDLMNYLQISEHEIKVIYLGIDHEVYCPGNEKFQQPTILWVGRIKKYKNLDHLIMAFGIVKKRISHARLIIVGTGDYESEARRLACELGLTDIVFLGKVKDVEKLELLRKSWILAITSMIEGWGVSILEAAACATATVGYDAGAIKEAVIDGRTGLLAKYGDITELADKICLILTDEKFRDKLSNGALVYSRNFDWDRTADETIKVVEEIMKCARMGRQWKSSRPIA